MTTLPTYDECMSNVAQAIEENHPVEVATAWTMLAREIREAGASAPTRYAVQDVQLRHCQCATYVVRLGTEGRWWHPGSRTWCDGDDPTEIQPQPAVAARRLPGQTTRDLAVRLVPRLRSCVNCGRRVQPKDLAAAPDPGGQVTTGWVWVHADTDMPMCHVDLPGQSPYADPGVEHRNTRVIS